MATAGTLVYNTKLDTSGMDRGLKGMTGKVSSTGSTIKSILGGLGIAALVSKGMSAISNSMDGAIKRLDTMNNFPKVMSNLGISTEASKKSIDKLSDKLQGLPTTLDAGALSVQRLTSKNGDIEKSTDLFLAMNNAILAGGAPMQMQESALEQLSQAYAKGKPDMTEWRTILSAMPAQMKQVATAMGYMDADALGEDLRKGNVSMNEFMDTLVNLNKKGVGNFQSFEEQARNSTGGIQTAITNMKTAITRGVANALDALDKSLKDANLGGISGVISNIGKVFGDVLKSIVPLIPPIINALASVYNWMKKHEKLTKVLVGTILGMVIAWKGLMIVGNAVAGIGKLAKVFSTITTIFKGLLTVIKLVGTAFKILGAVMMANPIGIIIAVVVALVAAFVILWKKSEKFRNFWKGLWNGIKQIVVGAWNGLKKIFTTVIDFVKTNWKTILLFLINPFAGAFKYLYDHSEKFRNFVNKVFTAIVDFFKSIPSFIASIPSKIIELLKQIPYYIGYAIGWIIGKGIELINWLKGLPERIWTSLKMALVYVALWVASMVLKAKEVATQFVSNVVTFFKTLPSKIWTFLKMAFTNVKNWVSNVVAKAREVGSRFISNVVNFFKTLPGKIWTFLVNAVSKIIEWRRNLIDKGKRAAQGLFNAVVNGIKGLPEKMKNIGKNVVTGIWNGIKNAKDWVLDRIKSFGSGIVKGLKKALKIGSPSKVFADEVGKWIPAGVAVGIDANTDSAMKSIDDMSSEMIRKMQSAVNMETGKLNANANVKGNSFLNTMVVNSQVTSDVYLDRTKVGQAVTPIVSQTLQKAGVR